jgi:hypothetical protein
MRRREFLGVIGGAAAAAWPLAARAQQPAKPVIGFVHPGSAQSFARPLSAFLKGLGETGYVEGRNVAIEYRWAGDRIDQLPAMVDDLVRRQVSVLAVLRKHTRGIGGKGCKHHGPHRLHHRRRPGSSGTKSPASIDRAATLAVELWKQHHRCVPSGRRIHRRDSQGREAGRLASGADDES